MLRLRQYQRLGGEQVLDFYAGRAGKPAAGHRARLTTLGICCTAPKARSKATIRVIRVGIAMSASRPLSATPDITTSDRDPSACRHPAPDLQTTGTAAASASWLRSICDAMFKKSGQA